MAEVKPITPHGQLAAHLIEVHGSRPRQALHEARVLLLAMSSTETCLVCDAWLRRQLEGFGK